MHPPICIYIYMYMAIVYDLKNFFVQKARTNGNIKIKLIIKFQIITNLPGGYVPKVFWAFYFAFFEMKISGIRSREVRGEHVTI